MDKKAKKIRTSTIVLAVLIVLILGAIALSEHPMDALGGLHIPLIVLSFWLFCRRKSPAVNI